MPSPQTVNTLHHNLAQYFSLDELKLLCHDAGINPESVPFSERGIDIYAFCIVESFRRHEMLPALLAECAKLRGQIAWNTFIANAEVPTEWAELLSPQPSIGNVDARDSQGLSIGNTGTLEQHFGDKINTHGGDVVYGSKTVGYSADQVAGLVNTAIAELTRERQAKPYDGRKPYPGLTAFRESDAPFFFGREDGVKQLLTRIGADGQRFVCITGASGSGKSSLVRAGLIPQLKQGTVDGAAEWRYADFSPQGEPLTQLAHALARLTGLSDAGDRFLQTYKNDDDALSQAIAPSLASASQKAVLFIDQFEELFTYKQDQPEDEAERCAFVSQITHAVQQAYGRIIVLIALRSDFVSPCLAYPELSRLLRDGFEPVTAMTPSELTRAIVQPALEVGLSVEPKLAAQVIADMRGEPGTLPLMQFALRDLLEAKNPQRGDGCELTLNDYLERGGMHQALQRHADTAFAKLDATHQPLVRGLFARLISPGRGTADTRRTVQLEQLVPAGQAEAPTQQVVQTLADARLLTTSGDENGTARTVTIAHETLLEAWPWLVTLRKELRNEIELQNEISDDAAKWEANARNAGYVYRDAQLAGVTKAMDTGKLGLDALSMAFVQAGRKRQARGTNLRRVVVSALVVLALAATGLAGWAMRQTEVAKIERDISKSRLLINESINTSNTSPERSMFLAIEALQIAIPVSIEATNQARNQVLSLLPSLASVQTLIGFETYATAIEVSPNSKWFIARGHRDSERKFVVGLIEGNTWSMRVISTTSEVIETHIRPDGKQFSVIQANGLINLYEPNTLSMPVLSITSSRNVASSGFTIDSKYLVGGTQDGSIQVFDSNSGKLIDQWQDANSSVTNLQVMGSASLSYLAIGHKNGIIEWVKLNGDAIEHQLQFQCEIDSPVSVDLSQDGQTLIATYSASRIYKIQAKTEVTNPCNKIFEQDTQIQQVSINKAGDLVLIAGDRGSWMLDTNQSSTPRQIGTVASSSNCAVFDKNDTKIATCSDKSLWVSSIDLDQRNPRFGHRRETTSAAFSPDSKWLISGSFDGTIKVWTADGSSRFFDPGSGDENLPFAISPDGKSFASAHENQLAFWNLDGQKSMIPTNGNRVVSIAFIDSGQKILYLDELAQITSIALSDHGFHIEDTKVISGLTNVFDAVFSKDGTKVIVLESPEINSSKSNIFIIERDNHLLGHHLNAPVNFQAVNLDMSTDGQRIALLTMSGQAFVYQTSPEYLLPLDRCNGSPSQDLALSKNGKLVAIANNQNSVCLWELKTEGQILRAIPYKTIDALAKDIALSDDNQTLAYVHEQGIIIKSLVDDSQGDLTLALTNDHVSFIRLNSDGSILASKSSDGSVRTWILNTENLLQLVCLATGRSLADAEETYSVGSPTHYNNLCHTISK